MLAAATSFFARTNISQSYNIGSSASTGSRTSTPGPSAPPTPSSAPVASIIIGLWRVQPASHKVTNKRVSVWTFDKRSPDLERVGATARDRTLEVLKAEAGALGRLRHPSILEMVEALEETRSEFIFATEPVLSSLEASIPGSSRFSPLVELDEVEIQKGILQICKGLSFLHSSAQLVHTNVSPETIIINGAGDWKISGLGLTIPLLTGGNPTRWEFPTFDGRVPSYIQRSFDYMAPEYALDEQLLTASDMYSLGCTIYAVHAKGNPPYKTHASLGGLRENAGKPIPGMGGWDPDLQALLHQLVTRHATQRPTPGTLPSHPFFSSLPISTLNFLDRSNFTAKTREEKISFMKGLTSVLDRFSEGLRTRKILPSLLEEMKDINLLPYILPNVFVIANVLSPQAFANLVLPSLKPLFAVKEPPQNMLTLLENLLLLQSKTDKQVFREQVLPLVYNALDSEHAAVQEKALAAVPNLCETIDYAEVQGTLFPRVAWVFTKTRILSVKVATLNTFLVMVKTLDQSTLTQKLVPLLSKIRTKEPAVMVATLSVQEAMGFKVDKEAVATLVLPQLWAMSMGPLLNVEQFKRFMTVIKKLSERVEREHDQFLRDSQRIEDRSGTSSTGANTQSYAGTVDFESLVGRADSISKIPGGNPAPATGAPSWEDDVWGSIFNETSPSPTPVPMTTLPATSPMSSPNTQHTFFPPKQNTTSVTLPFNHGGITPRPTTLGARTLPAVSTPAPSNQAHPLQPASTGLHSPLNRPLRSSALTAKPNYNVSLSTVSIPSTPPVSTDPPFGFSMGRQPMINTMAPLPITASLPPPMSATDILTPARSAPVAWSSAKKPTQAALDEFDPLA